MELQTFLETKKRAYYKAKKQLKRKAFFLKAKIFLVCVLPVVILLLAVKVIQTLVRIKLREGASAVLSHGEPVKKPVVQIREKPEFVTPVPVSSDTPSQDIT